GRQNHSSEGWKSGARPARNRPAVRSREPPTATSSPRPPQTTVAAAAAVPRRDRRTRRADPESVPSDPPGSSGAESRRVSASTQEAEHFASASRTPPSDSGTNSRVVRSNSRSSTASAPPRDRRIRARSSAGRRTTVPAYTQLTPSREA